MRILTASALLLLLLPTTALAQVQNRFRVQGILSNPTGDYDDGRFTLEIEDAAGFKAAWELLFTERLGLEVAAATAKHDVVRSFNGITLATLGDLQITPVTASLLYHFRPKPKLDVYLGGGAAYVFYGDVSSDDLGDFGVDDDFTYTLQAGVDLFLWSAWGLSGGLAYIDTEAVDEVGEAFPVEAVVISFGGVYSF